MRQPTIYSSGSWYVVLASTIFTGPSGPKMDPFLKFFFGNQSLITYFRFAALLFDCQPKILDL
jgi:hypothetical protein